MNAPVSKPMHTISVRDLVEFVLRQGDLGGEREFVGSDRALAGIRGHQKIQRSRPTGYLTELPVEHRVETDEFTLQIRGRIDGLPRKFGSDRRAVPRKRRKRPCRDGKRSEH